LRKVQLIDIAQNGAAALFLLRLAQTAGDGAYRESAHWALDAFGGNVTDYGIHASTFGRALDEYLSSEAAVR
jgi:uncharacterized protein YyaL (SSP411 family)